MRLHRLHAVGLIGRDPIDLDFDSLPGAARTIAIVGPNGAGKSTTLQAVFAALHLDFPDHPGRLPQQFKGRKGQIELEWSFNGQRYRSLVKVGPSGADGSTTEAFLFLDDSKIALPETPGGTRAYTAAIASRFMPASESLSTWFTSQRREGQFHTLGRTEKKTFVRRRLNLERLIKIADAAGGRAATLASQIDALTARLADIERQQAGLAEQRGILEGALADLGSATNARQTAADRAVEIERQVAALAQRLEGRARLEADLATLQADRQKLRDRFDELATAAEAEEAMLARRGEIEGASALAELADAEIKRLQEEAAAGQTELDALQAKLLDAAGVRTEIADLGRALHALLLKAETEHKDAVAAANQVVRDAEAAVREAKAALRAAESTDAVDRAEADVAFRAQAVETARAQIADARRRVGMMAEVPCAGQSSLQEGCALLADARQGREKEGALTAALLDLEASLADAREDLKRSQADREAAIASARTAVDQANATLTTANSARAAIPMMPKAGPATADLQDKIDDLQASLASYPTEAVVAEARREIAAATTAIQAAQARAATLRDLAAQAPLLEAASRRLGELGRESAQIEDQGKALSERIDALQGEIAGFERLQAELATARMDLASVTGTRDRLQETESQIRDRVGRIRGAIDALEALGPEATKAIADRAELLDRKAVWEHLAIAFQSIPNFKIDAAGPQVSALVNQLLEECFGTRFRVEFETLRALRSREGSEEVFDIRVIDAEQGTSALLGDKSGGETVIIGEALSLGLSLWSAIASGRRVETLIRDEADGALSEDRVVGYFQMLDRAGRIGGFHRQYFISHRQTLQEMADARLYLDGGKFTVG